MKIIAGAFILLATALGLPSVVGKLDPSAPGDFINVPDETAKDFCRLTYEQIADDVYRCEPVEGQVEAVE
ncbi:hypothetical protein [Sphingomicrobium clamense]|uniref:Uncharacterized protein n=1 Tax=Sphingomicrobium clamense TaxID=2851013 RepID=A0ABS6V507_9SPHN|nr:hypothetical protein [Sphingomicrobium sp. B8]MBW0144633.1 hypothetical protein [Sphingomicrobium sp. B8]